jgi:hypothetical protein
MSYQERWNQQKMRQSLAENRQKTAQDRPLSPPTDGGLLFLNRSIHLVCENFCSPDGQLIREEGVGGTAFSIPSLVLLKSFPDDYHAAKERNSMQGEDCPARMHCAAAHQGDSIRI